jgi:hypothetical protein
MLLAAHLTPTAGFQAASALSADELAAITNSAADFQPAGAGHYCAGTLAIISAAIITSWTADACMASPPAASPPSLNSAAETLSLNSPGYTLVFTCKWCPNCNSNLIDSRDF